MSHRSTRPSVAAGDESLDSGDEAIGSKRDLSTTKAMQEDSSGEDSDEWKPEDHPPPSDAEDDEMDVDTSEREEEEENDEEEEKDDEGEEEDELEEDQEEEEKDATMVKKEKGQDDQGKGNEGGTSETYVIRCLTDTNIIAQCRHDVQIRPQETTTYAHRIL